jgi:hypothetical protein
MRRFEVLQCTRSTHVSARQISAAYMHIVLRTMMMIQNQQNAGGGGLQSRAIRHEHLAALEVLIQLATPHIVHHHVAKGKIKREVAVV